MITIGEIERRLVDVVAIHTHAPAFVRLTHRAAKCLGHELVAKTDTDHFASGGVALAHKAFQCADPVLVVVNAALAPGDQEAICRLHAVGQLSRLHIPGGKRQGVVFGQ